MGTAKATLLVFGQTAVVLCVNTPGCGKAPFTVIGVVTVLLTQVPWNALTVNWPLSDPVRSTEMALLVASVRIVAPVGTVQL